MTLRAAVLRGALAAGLGMAGLGMGAAMAAEPPLALPLTAPAGADPVIADFVDVCSTGLVKLPEAITLASQRGWKSDSDTPLDALTVAATGNVALTKKLGDGQSLLLIQRVVFPHVIATNCSLQLRNGPASADPSVLSKITGIAGGIVPLVDAKAGRWSFVDSTDHVVTILSTPIGSDSLFLSMGRSERLDPDTNLPIAKSP